MGFSIWITSGRVTSNFYRPQRSCGKAIFSPASVSHSVQGGCLPQCMLGYTTSLAGTPQQVHPLWTGSTPGRYTPLPGRYTPSWAGTPPGRSLQRTVRTLLDVKLANENPTALSTLDHVMQVSHYNDLFHVLIRWTSWLILWNTCQMITRYNCGQYGRKWRRELNP